MVMIGVGNGIAHRIQEMLRRDHIRVAEAQIDDIPPVFPHLCQLHVHLGPEISFEQV
jgi:DNA polymerase/3'-5' exonuclease PolX